MAETMESSNSPPDLDDGGGWVTPKSRRSRSRVTSNPNAAQFQHVNRQLNFGVASNDIVLIIEPTDENTKEQSDQFLYNGRVRKDSILSSLIGNYVDKIKSMKVSRDGKKVIVVLANESNSIPDRDIDLFFSINMVGECHVECRKPKGNDKMIGVIQNFHQLSSLDSIKEELYNKAIEFSKIERIMRNRNGRREPTTAVLVEFKNLNEMPKSIIIDFCKYNIREYEQDPIRCFKCQGFGHFARNCQSNIVKCGRCSLDHSTKDCNIEKLPGTSNRLDIKCANCKGNHPAFSRQCPTFIENKAIKRVQDERKVSYASAVKIMKDTRGDENNNTLRHGQVHLHEYSRPYRQTGNFEVHSSQNDFFDDSQNPCPQPTISDIGLRSCNSQFMATQVEPKLNVDRFLEVLQDDKVMRQIHESIIELFPVKLIVNYLHLFVSACMPTSVKLNKDAKQKAHSAFEAIFGNLKGKDKMKTDRKRARDLERSTDNLNKGPKLDVQKKSKN